MSANELLRAVVVLTQGSRSTSHQPRAEMPRKEARHPPQRRSGALLGPPPNGRRAFGEDTFRMTARGAAKE
eukprot:15439689-Alexandrium_andersonii.AAC.1